MESTKFESWTSRFETRDVTSALLMFDYIRAVLINYTLSNFLGDFIYRIGYKMVLKRFKNGLIT